MSGQHHFSDGAGPSSGEVALTTAAASSLAREEDPNNGGAPTPFEVRNLELGDISHTSRDDGASSGGGSYYLNDDRDLSSKPNKGAGGPRTGAADEGDPALMEDVPPEKQITVEYGLVTAWVPASFEAQSLRQKLKSFGRTKNSSERQILFNVTGRCRPGEVLAFMGPSGSGKTSLLSIIGGRAQSMMRKEGEVRFNGAPPNKSMKRSLGYVMQDDLMYESLTVFEVLFYAAQLRLPRSMSRVAQKERVNTVIKALGLNDCKDTIIGGFFRKGISGGERKRCSVGHELLINPSILLLDEPTSGLDSTTAMHLLTSLRRLAQGGRSVITTIHQPSSRLYQQLDKLLLLSQGHAMYYGKADHAVVWFGRLGYGLPYGVNAADFILDLASSDIANDERDGEESRMYLIEAFEGTKAAQPKWDTPESRQPGPQSGGKAVFSLDPSSVAGGGLGGGSRWGATYGTQFSVLLSRAIRVRRFQALSKEDISLLVIAGVLAGLFWLQKAKGDTIADARQTLGLLFFELVFVAVRSMFTALFTFPEERKMLLKERASGMYRLSAFYFARLASDIPMEFSIPLIFIILIYFMGGLRVDSGVYFFQNWFAVMLVTAVCQAFGLLLGCISMDPKTAQTIATVVFLAQMLTAGYFVTTIPVWIAWLRYVSFFFYGFGLILHIEYKGRTIYECVATDSCTQLDPGSPENNPQCSPESLQRALHLIQDPNDHKWVPINVCVLIGFVVLLQLLVYVFLRKKTARI